MPEAQLLRVAGGLGQGLPVVHVAGQLLAPLGLKEAGLVCAAVKLGPTLGKVLLVLIVTLEPANVEEMLHPWVIVDAAIPDLQASVPQESLFVLEITGDLPGCPGSLEGDGIQPEVVTASPGLLPGVSVDFLDGKTKA